MNIRKTALAGGYYIMGVGITAVSALINQMRLETGTDSSFIECFGAMVLVIYIGAGLAGGLHLLTTTKE